MVLMNFELLNQWSILTGRPWLHISWRKLVVWIVRRCGEEPARWRRQHRRERWWAVARSRTEFCRFLGGDGKTEDVVSRCPWCTPIARLLTDGPDSPEIGAVGGER
ncbi:nudix hydrolase homolog 13 [Striga asiatica]|uniref:Nudix hydrolase homolog 13 n=1 Tax=Striga asiatica TaxID=4170 RepID=A0A5A7QF15_STRAF|nr:nudix hydrolase homolog 13 [Striga asiatica]